MVRVINTAPLVAISGNVIEGVGLDRNTGLVHRIDPLLRACVPAEPPTEQAVRDAVDFLFNEWRNGALLGLKSEEAFFVRCDRSTMTQNDLDNGRLVCLIGVAALRPAEYVIFRIGQWTASRSS